MALTLLDWLRLSPFAPWHYLTYQKDTFFNNQRATDLLGWKPLYGNQDILISAYDAFRKHREEARLNYGVTHRKDLKQGLLGRINAILSGKHAVD